jgi:ketosteroid isomerase-like protein
MDPTTQRRIEIAKRLFEGWSSGDPDGPQELMTPDAVLHDIASGTFEGWPAIRAFFAAGLAKWDDLKLVPDEFWSNDDGVAVHYVMSATVKDPSTTVRSTWARSGPWRSCRSSASTATGSPSRPASTTGLPARSLGIA